MKTSGFDELSKQLNQMQKKAEELHGENSITFEDMFSKEFMTTHTKTDDIYKFLEDGGFDSSSQETFELIDESKLDIYVDKSTNFSTWQEMLNIAGNEYVAKELGF
ncbi:hypothetical protein JD978_000513 [Listeria monocytogenes]|nr:hypothetical protein [Listeria monocytogenes]